MRYTPYVIAAAIAGTIAGCAQPYYYDRDDYPNYAYYQPGYHYPTRYEESTYPPRRYYYTSKWDYYRHYNGSFSPGPEQYP